MPEPEAKSATLTTLVSLMQDVFSSCAASIEKIEYSPSNRTHIACMVHYLHATKNARACMSLIKTGDFCAIPIVLRAVIESAASLKNIKTTEGYADQLWDDTLLRYRDDIKRFSKLVSSVASSESKDEANRIIKEIESLDVSQENRSRKKISQHDKFSAAGMNDDYVLLYSSFSGITHGNLLSLFQEHTIIENGTILVVDQDIKSHAALFQLSDVLLSATYTAVESTYSILGLDGEKQLVQFRNIIDDFRSIFLKSSD